MIEFFDTHSHYNDEKFDIDREVVFQKIENAGVSKFIIAGYDIESSKKAIQLAQEQKQYAIVGISPNDVPEKEENIDSLIQEIGDLTQDAKVVAIGEIGLDYYWNKENKEIQKEIFMKQIALANKLHLPIVIHTREAVMDTIEILKQNPVENKGVFHCCPLNRELVKEALKLGFHISFAGPVTYKSSKNAAEIIKEVPLDKILIETDCPYLPPEPLRGTRNDSTNLKYIVEKIAKEKEMTEEEIASISYQNAEKIFKISEKYL